jgi:hypothetical protein
MSIMQNDGKSSTCTENSGFFLLQIKTSTAARFNMADNVTILVIASDQRQSPPNKFTATKGTAAAAAAEPKFPHPA